MAYLIQTGNAISLVEHNRIMAKKVNDDPSLKWKATAITLPKWKKWSTEKFFNTMASLKIEDDVSVEMLGDRLEVDDSTC